MKEFFKLVKKDLAQNAGFGIIAFLYIIFVRLITYIAAVSNIIEYYNKNPDAYTTPVKAAEEYMGTGNFYHIFAVTVLACCFALLTCYYLHRRKTVDFYHALPLKRTTIFGVKYLTGIIIFVLGFGINYILMLAASLAMGVLTPAVAFAGFKALINGIFGYAFIYSVGVLAGLLTATIVTHIVMGTILMFILPAVVFLWHSWMSFFYVTFRQSVPDWIYTLSPLVYFCERCISTITGENVSSIKTVLFMAAGTAVFTAVDFLVCRLRKSESTGKALAFRELNEPLRVVFSLLSAVIGGFISSVMFSYNSKVSFLAGFFVVLVLSSLIIEIIFRFDFTAALRNKRQLLLSVVLGVLLAGGTFLSLKPYNTYVPKAENIDYAAVSVSFLESDEIYKEEIDGKLSYFSSNDYIFKSMKFTNSELLENLFSICAEKYENMPAFTTSYDDYHEDSDADNDLVFYLNIKCTLKSGRTYCRVYSTYYSKFKGILDELVESPEYKAALWGSFYNMNKESIDSVGIEYLYDFYSDKNVYLSSEEVNKLYDAICEDAEKLTLKEMTEVSPVCKIKFYSGKYRRSADYSPWEYIPSSAEMYIYPSFENTIALLEEMGVKLYTAEETAADIDRVSIVYYDNEGNPNEVFYDKEEIKEILECTCPGDLSRLQYLRSDYSIWLQGGSETNGEGSYVQFDSLKGVPEFVKERFEERTEEEQQ